MTRTAKSGSKRKQQKTGLNRSILDVGWGMLTSAVKYKLGEGGGVFVDVPTKKVKRNASLVLSASISRKKNFLNGCIAALTVITRKIAI